MNINISVNIVYTKVQATIRVSLALGLAPSVTSTDALQPAAITRNNPRRKSKSFVDHDTAFA